MQPAHRYAFGGKCPGIGWEYARNPDFNQRRLYFFRRKILEVPVGPDAPMDVFFLLDAGN